MENVNFEKDRSGKYMVTLSLLHTKGTSKHKLFFQKLKQRYQLDSLKKNVEKHRRIKINKQSSQENNNQSRQSKSHAADIERLKKRLQTQKRGSFSYILL